MNSWLDSSLPRKKKKLKFKNLSVKKCGPIQTGQGGETCEIHNGGQEIAVVVS